MTAAVRVVGALALAAVLVAVLLSVGAVGPSEPPTGPPGAADAQQLAEDATEVIAYPEGSVETGLPPLPDTEASDELPVPKGVEVRTSDTVSAEGRVQVSLVGDSEAAPPTVLAGYRKALSAQGFTEEPVPASAGSIASSFARGDDRLTVTVAPDRRGTTLSVFGHLTPERSE